MQSKYLEKYGKPIASSGKGQLLRDFLLVEVFEDDAEDTDEGYRKTEGGIYVGESEHARAEYNMLKSVIGVVVEVGEGYVDENGEDVPLDIPIGAIIWFPASAVNYCTTIPGLKEALPRKTLALVSAQSVRKMWKTGEDYKHDKELIRGKK